MAAPGFGAIQFDRIMDDHADMTLSDTGLMLSGIGEGERRYEAQVGKRHNQSARVLACEPYPERARASERKLA